jgi:hypothetical protein
MILGHNQNAMGHPGTAAMDGPLKSGVFPQDWRAGITGGWVKREASVGL